MYVSLSIKVYRRRHEYISRLKRRLLDRACALWKSKLETVKKFKKICYRMQNIFSSKIILFSYRIQLRALKFSSKLKEVYLPNPAFPPNSGVTIYTENVDELVSSYG